MRVFVTGATGFIGSAIVQALAGAGHTVLGLARSDASAGALSRLGIEAHRGDLADPDSLAAGARACDGVIHTAFIHDFAQYQTSVETDRLAVEALGAALVDSDKPLVIASGTAMLAFAAPGQVGAEDDAPPPTIPRIAAEEAALSTASRGVRASVVRLPPSVHGDGDRGFLHGLISTAREKGVSAYVGEGRNRWPAVHRLDAADLFKRALENGSAGTRYHAVAEEGVAVAEIAGVIARRLGVPLARKTAEEAGAHFGFLGMILALDCPASSARTRAALGWRPTQAGLIADLDHGRYFDG